MIEAGIDEVTIILLPSDELINTPNFRWDDAANRMIYTAEEQLRLIELFGEKSCMKSAISGYSVEYTYGNCDFLFAVCYHHTFVKMGVLIRFSAQAFAYYQEQTNLLPYEILQTLHSPLFQVRCSRIDIAIDYINEGIDIGDIYEDYMSGDLKVFVMREHNGRVEQISNNYRTQGIFTEGKCETLVFGKRESAVMLRIYNKKVEQISKRGTRYSEALQYNDWVRFEVEAKQFYAHNLTYALLNTKNEIEYKEIVLGFIIQKFYFAAKHNDNYIPTPYTKKLIEMKNDNSITLFKSLTAKNTDLSKSLLHLLKTSGTTSTLYKIKAIWGNDGLENCIKIISNYINAKSYIPNADCISFLKNHGKDYECLYKDFNTFFDNEIKPELE